MKISHSSGAMSARGRARNLLVVCSVLASILPLGCGSNPNKEAPPVEAVQAGEPEVAASKPAIASGPPLIRRPVTSAPPRPTNLFPGTGQFVGAPVTTGEEASPSGDGVQLNFIDTDIRAVLSSVLGDALGVTYTVDPSVRGNLTLQSARPVPRSELIAALEGALRLSDLALVGSNGTYSVVPARDAARHVGSLRQPQSARTPGFGVQIVPLRYTSPVEMEKVLQPFVPAGSVVRVDEARNLLLLAGTSQELNSMMDIVQTFDVDWMAGMSFALLPLEYVDAKTLADELKTIFADTKSPLGSIVRFVPMSRLNALLVVSPQQEYLAQAQTWVKRLDLGQTTPGRHIYVYDVQNSRAGDLANSLNRIFGTGSEGMSTAMISSSTVPGPNGTISASQVAPVTAQIASTSESSGQRIVPNDDNNSLMIYASPSEFSVIEGALKRLDVPSRQVLIEAVLAEVSLNDDLRFGLQWSYQFNNGSVTLSEVANGAIASKFPGFSYVYAGSSTIQGVLNSLEAITKIKVISSPKLMVLNNHEALLQVGDQVPTVTQSAVSVSQTNAPIVNSVQLRDTGVILRVTPRVNKSGTVLLDINQEVSSVIPTTTSAIDSPTIQQRRINSTIAVQDGQTIALGGLITNTVTHGNSGLPWLSRIPVLGYLFGRTSDISSRTELIVLIRPRVMRDAGELREVMDDLGEQFKNVMPADTHDPKPAQFTAPH